MKMEWSKVVCLKLPRSKLDDKKPTVAVNDAVVYCPMSDYKKNEIDVITCGPCATS